MKDLIPIWEKAALSVEEAAAYTGVGEGVIRALAHAAKHGRSDFPAFWIGKGAKIPRHALIDWLKDVAMSHRDLRRAEIVVERVQEQRGRGRPRKGVVA